MEITYSQLKQKDVINLSDGKNLGKVCDITFDFPAKNLIGLTVTGSRGFKLTKQDVFIPADNIVKIGEDAVLIKFGSGGEKPPKDKCPPKRPPCKPEPPCPPPCPPCPPDRRSYDEYE